jgi:isocitrate dehydrogenase kinase/phosphatase
MQMRTASERLKRKADMDEFENRYLSRRRMDEERMNRLLSSQREIIDIVQGLLGRRDDRG